MANVIIITDICRASYVHLDKPFGFNDDKEPKYALAAMFPKSGQGAIAGLGVNFPSSRNSIVDAIKQVVREEFGFEFDPENQDLCKQYGIQFPPNFKDGDKVFQKDEKGFPIPGQVDPIQGGHYILNLKADADSQPGCVSGKTITPIAPTAVYSGCWVRCQIEVSAFTTKVPSRIISVRLLNVMMCYDDEAFGAAGPKQDATSAFAGLAVANSNLSAGVGQGNFQPVAQAPAKPTPPKPVPVVQVTPKLVMNTDCEYSYDDLKGAGFTDAQMVEGGYATMQVPTKPIPVAPPAKPAAPTPPAKPVIPTTGTVIMKPGSEYTYEQLSKEFGWTDDEIVTGGYATPNFTNPQ